MRTETPVTIFRKDYLPFSHQISHVALEFDLEPTATLVKNTMRFTKASHAATGSMTLDGSSLELISVELDGIALPTARYVQTESSLTLLDLPDQGVLTITNRINPQANTALDGLYMSGGRFFSQCEAQGFRCITFFPDRPDVMSRYDVTVRADKVSYPYLLSNGNLLAQRDLPDGRHEAKWQDPFAKPSYLFALVAGDFFCHEEQFKLADGRTALLQVYVEHKDHDKTAFAMESLKKSIAWDEHRFNLELDLDRYMIVAVDDFNMGAMENKGLNLFNTSLVLAHPSITTDMDYGAIEAVVGHEYFHNWTGNRVTCRDWFQLSLKEGLTVFRDQEFSSDMAAQGLSDAAAASARSVIRIDNVRGLRSMQFPEDAGPMAHPIRPDSYQEINNFYTATVYEKGSEIIRMQHTLLGDAVFNQGMAEYFKRHDGQAVTCEDFVSAMEFAYQNAKGRDLKQFRNWYSQAGTPLVKVQRRYDAAAKTYHLTLTQSCPKVGMETQAGTPDKQPFHIPMAMGLLDAAGSTVPLMLDGKALGLNTVLDFTQATQTFSFTSIAAEPVPSLLRGFSAPVRMEIDYSTQELAFLIAHDSDPFNRWEAAQRLGQAAVKAQLQAPATPATQELINQLTQALRAVLVDTQLDAAFKDQVLTLPAESFIADQIQPFDAQPVHIAREAVRKHLGTALHEQWLDAYHDNQISTDYSPDPISAGKRSLKNLALSYLLDSAQGADHIGLAQQQYESANNMTDRLAAITHLLNSAPQAAQALLQDFYQRFEQEALAINKWFTLQATARHTTAAIVRTLAQHNAFTLKNPNRARSLIFRFCMANPAQFHAADGSGYALWADYVIALNAINPQIASRLARTLERWQQLAPHLQGHARAALERVNASENLSVNVAEIVQKALHA